MSGFIITKLERQDGYWTARVSAGGVTVAVDRRYGSWQALVRDAPGLHSFHRAEVLPAVAAALQERVRPVERAERAARDAAAKAAKAAAS